MATTLCTVAEVGNYLGLTFNGTSKPTDTVVESWINRNEGDIYTRTARYFSTTDDYKQVVDAVRNMNYVYNYGYGIRINLFHQHVRTFDYNEGDRVQFWTGANWQDILTENNGGLGTMIKQDELNGWVFLRGHIFTAIHANRFRFTYRYGEATVPDDIKKACILMTVCDLLRIGALFWKVLPLGGDSGLRDINRIAKELKEEADDIISRNTALVPIV